MHFINHYERSEFESASVACEVHDDGGRRVKIPERLLQSLWYDQAFRRDALRVEDGRPAVLLSPGAWNVTGGPDFRHARVRLGEEVLTGDVEVHLRSSDWHRHGHSADADYGGVILHVVYEHDAARPCLSAFRREEIPTLVLSRYLDGDLEYLAQRVDVRGYPGEGVGGLGQCYRHLQEEPGAFAAALGVVEEAGDARFARLTRRFERLLESMPVEELLYRGILEGLGFRRNRVAFAELARRMPWSRVRAAAREAPERERAAVVQAALLGAAGMLEAAPAGDDADTAAYRRGLLRRWREIRTSDAGVMPDGMWRMRNVRPLHHPARRIGGAGHVLAARVEGGLVPDLITRLKDASGDPEGLEAVFDAPADAYWTRRVALGPPVFDPPVRPVGFGLARIIALNILLPFAAALGHRRQDASLGRAARAAFRALPSPADNAVAAFVRHRMLGSRRERRWREWRRALDASAGRQQGLIQIYKDRCARGPQGCEGCPVMAAMRADSRD